MFWIGFWKLIFLIFKGESRYDELATPIQEFATIESLDEKCEYGTDCFNGVIRKDGDQWINEHGEQCRREGLKFICKGRIDPEEFIDNFEKEQKEVITFAEELLNLLKRDKSALRKLRRTFSDISEDSETIVQLFEILNFNFCPNTENFESSNRKVMREIDEIIIDKFFKNIDNLTIREAEKQLRNFYIAGIMTQKEAEELFNKISTFKELEKSLGEKIDGENSLSNLLLKSEL